MRILVVDDSELSRHYIVGVLGQLPNVELVAAGSGEQALAELAAGDISLVLCNYELPDMSGMQVLRFARQAHSGLELPLLVLTSREDSEVKVRALREGANDYVARQAQPEELLARVRTQVELLLARRQLEAASRDDGQHRKFETIGHLTDGLAHELDTPAQAVHDNLAFMSESFEALGVVVEELRQQPSAAARALVEAALKRIEYDYLAKEVPRCVAESKQGIEHVAAVIRALREFAQAGLPERSVVSLNDVVRGAADLTRVQWQHVAELDLQLTTNLEPVECVRLAIEQVVLLALLNVIHALGGRRAAASKGRLALRTSRDGDWALIEIGDGAAGGGAHSAADGQQRTERPAFVLARAVVVDQHAGQLDVGGTHVSIRLPLLRSRLG